MSGPLLKTDSLSKAFGKVVCARELDLAFQAGVLTSIIGPNGAGKSTLINVITGSLTADNGRIYFLGKDITRLPIHRRVKQGLCRSFQVVNVFPHLSVFENVGIPILTVLRRGHRFWRPLAKEARVHEEVMALLERVGLANEARRLATELSHGDQRLLEVAIALAARPKLLFLDEPTAGMNPVERGQIMEDIRRLNDEGSTTFVIVEHDMDVVFSLSDRILVLHRGEIICDGDPARVSGDALVRECYLGEEVA
ncbi:MAG: ABC transporter ATP-binding protein [Proteobacteria bacterium]|nr:ABC transporter ATP-binding protein [Pseudomonadota bacterium]MBU1740158.1 ABC transporter ATP-binding protein [Pseudomonadota bacterium]